MIRRLYKSENQSLILFHSFYYTLTLYPSPQQQQKQNSMLWRRNHSIYTPPTQKLDHLSQVESGKLKNALAPISSFNHQTIDQPQNKYIIRKQSKSKTHKNNLVQGTFFLHRGNNHMIIKTVLQQMGYSETLSKDHSSLIWYQGKDIVKKDFLKKQYNPKAINYLPNHSQITNKQKLYENISKYDPSSVGTYIPKTFVVDFKDLQLAQQNLTQFLVAYFKKLGVTKPPKKSNSLCITNYYGEICIPFVKILRSLNDGSKSENKKDRQKTNLWIVKPSFLNRGQGIQIISNLRQLQNILSEDSQQISIRMYQPQEKNSSNCFIIQQYIMDPLLYLGYKFDMRVWILLRSSRVNGLQLYIYKTAYARIACHKYSEQQKEQNNGFDDVVDLKEKQKLIQKQKTNENSPSIKGNKMKSLDNNDRFMHLTNNAVQKNCKQYGILHQGNQLLISQIVEKLAVPQLTQPYLYNNFKKMTKTLIQSAKEKLVSKATYGSFQLMGLDFMIDRKLNLWLIEANCNPCLEESSTILKNLIPKMLKEMFETVKIQKIMGNKESSIEESDSKKSDWERIL